MQMIEPSLYDRATRQMSEVEFDELLSANKDMALLCEPKKRGRKPKAVSESHSTSTSTAARRCRDRQRSRTSAMYYRREQDDTGDEEEEEYYQEQTLVVAPLRTVSAPTLSRSRSLLQPSREEKVREITAFFLKAGVQPTDLAKSVNLNFVLSALENLDGTLPKLLENHPKLLRAISTSFDLTNIQASLLADLLRRPSTKEFQIERAALADFFNLVSQFQQFM